MQSVNTSSRFTGGRDVLTPWRHSICLHQASGCRSSKVYVPQNAALAVQHLTDGGQPRSLLCSLEGDALLALPLHGLHQLFRCSPSICQGLRTA